MTVPTPSSHNPDPSHSSPSSASSPVDGVPGGPEGAGPSAPPPISYPGGADQGHGSGFGHGDGLLVRRELRDGVVCAVAVAVVGVLLGLLWLWLAPRVPLFTDGKAVYLKDPEGEESVGADGTFTLLGLAFGLVAGIVVFLCRKKGGVGLVVGLTVGGLLGSLLAWRVGVWLGPETDLVAAAKAAGKNATFDAPLKLQAKGALLAWPLAAIVVHLVLTGFFGPRDPDPEPEQPLW
ncbi:MULTISPECIES: hypothetical protein [unclassified Streptomyces]|uniref:hypothetical protein n=1 Tax=unclassified Streptomyces TaxID=2593676 RepID=UPI002DDC8F76|nr:MULTISPECIES: hypothetical protein [unclassified Streptomyces]WSA95355.1 hypothetical protein OIE63_30200 [Streptomyces sp. NBC_01795]WSB79773.1 hypothetical protein OHB04_31310 [Streptomyces sp. NBC_01775]WSS12020.1 hypothetical protein OG533_08900 [Streptomyces sp. NBC_01186]WSS40734.1 hypothetical protein OG220_09060 [Streptomyces sp. NBC_01187]